MPTEPAPVCEHDRKGEERPVDVDGWWELVESARDDAGGDWTRVPERVTDRLAA